MRCERCTSYSPKRRESLCGPGGAGGSTGGGATTVRPRAFSPACGSASCRGCLRAVCPWRPVRRCRSVAVSAQRRRSMAGATIVPLCADAPLEGGPDDLVVHRRSGLTASYSCARPDSVKRRAVEAVERQVGQTVHARMGEGLQDLPREIMRRPSEVSQSIDSEGLDKDQRSHRGDEGGQSRAKEKTWGACGHK